MGVPGEDSPAPLKALRMVAWTLVGALTVTLLRASAIDVPAHRATR
ncbi:hypothetical protein P2318_33295 [Myxococcaceae bacterium GXIMD 01537]